MKKLQMILALACMTSLTACQEASESTSNASSTTTSSSTQVDSTSSGGDSGTIIPEPVADSSEMVDDVSLMEEIEISKKDAEDESDVPEDSQREVPNDEVPFEVPEDEEHRELLLYINEVDIILDSFEESLRTITNTAVEYLLNPENTALLDTYCQNMVDAGSTLREIGTVLPPVDYENLHNVFAEDCEALADAYHEMVQFLQTGTDNSQKSMELEMAMAQLFANMQESNFKLGEVVIDVLNS